MTRAKGLLAILLILCGAATHAASPLEDYIAIRDAAVVAIDARIKTIDKVDADVSSMDAKALADLETRLRAMIGPVTVAGFGAVTRSNLETLIQELGFGQMDGLVATTADGKSSVIVTTVPLFMQWLRGHRTWWGEKGAAMPQDIAAALRTEAFYTQATSHGAAMVAYGTLPVTPPNGTKLAAAILGARTQDQSPPVPDQMFVAIEKGGRVFIGNAPLDKAMMPIRVCDAVRAAFKTNARQAFARKQYDRSNALEKEGDEAQRKCFAEKMPADARAQATTQAQAFIEALAGK